MSNTRTYGQINNINTVCPVSTRQNPNLSAIFIAGILLISSIVLIYLAKLQTDRFKAGIVAPATAISNQDILPTAVISAPIEKNQKLASYYDYDLKGYPNYSQTHNTAASQDFPKGTMLKVCRLRDHTFPPRCTIVRVNDFGPEHCKDNPIACPDRHIDLSSKAFKELAPLKIGLLEVTITPVTNED
jgi:rare lipoprotein A (peptidoglycan hydrolase)